jgi:hypothetical protein
MATNPTSSANAPEKIKNPFTVVSFAVIVMLLSDLLPCPRDEV